MSKILPRETYIILLIAGAMIGLFVYFGIFSKSAPKSSNTQIWRDNAPTKGNVNPTIKIVEFGDFECPTCKAMAPIFDHILQQNGDAALQFRYFPLPEHHFAKQTAVAAEVAAEQGKFWQMHDLLFQNQQSWVTLPSVTDSFGAFLTLVGADNSQFLSNQDQTAIDVVNLDDDTALALGLSGTPSIFINSIQYNGALSEKDINAAVSAARLDSNHH